MLRIAVIGGGSHSRGNHLPALARYVAEHPGAVECAACCDLSPEVAVGAARAYGFGRCYIDVEEMLASEALGGCIAVTPIPATATVAKQVMAAGVPLLMEKPPGATPAEARELRDLAAQATAPVMVSMNRRFDPALAAAIAWRGDRPLGELRAAMFREQRTESDFFTDTAIHALDAMRSIAGDVLDCSSNARRVDGVWWYRVRLQFAAGVTGLLEVMPSCGAKAERYEMSGPGYRVLATAGEIDAGEFIAREGKRIVQRDEPARGMPPFVQNGTFTETVEFLEAIRDGRVPHPTPAEVWPSVDLCHRIQEEAAGGRDRGNGTDGA